MTKKQAEELIAFGQQPGMHVKITTEKIKGVLYVNFRDYQLSNFVQAAIILQNIQRSEIPSSYEHLVA
jgi:hypothetical protein